MHAARFLPPFYDERGSIPSLPSISSFHAHHLFEFVFKMRQLCLPKCGRGIRALHRHSPLFDASRRFRFRFFSPLSQGSTLWEGHFSLAAGSARLGCVPMEPTAASTLTLLAEYEVGRCRVTTRTTGLGGRGRIFGWIMPTVNARSRFCSQPISIHSRFIAFRLFPFRLNRFPWISPILFHNRARAAHTFVCCPQHPDPLCIPRPR